MVSFCRLRDTAVTPQELSIEYLIIGPRFGSRANSDGFAHTVKADDGLFQSPLINGKESFTQKLTTPGSYEYHCTIHPFMKGKVVVQ